MKCLHVIHDIGLVVLLFALLNIIAAHLEAADVATIKPDVRSGFSNAGWKYDRYKNLASLDANKRMTVADLKGPGIIRHIHTTRHQPKDLAARGVVLEIWFDDADRPAVMSPLADFFGDGCNGSGKNFTSKHIECAPWSYNCYFPMPFAKRARVVLRNDTNKNLMNYSYVEWENLPKWDDSLGYFHATYRRKCLQLTKETRECFFEVHGTGHVLGRQYSVITNEPLFRKYNFVMEGNNEIDIDGRERQLDYLGTEDSFTFSWGFRETFAGLRAGMALVEVGDLNRLSMYRFHDHMPIRFTNSLRWSISWRNETYFTQNPKWPEAVKNDGCWVDYATVYYWYQKKPGGYKHEKLNSLEKRSSPLLRSSRKPVDIDPLFDTLDVDKELANAFSTEKDLERVRVVDAFAGTHPFWIDEPKTVGGHPGNPNPGKKGILALHAKSERKPCLLLRKVTLPEGGKPALRIVVSGDPYERPGKSDFLLQAGVHDGGNTTWFKQEVIKAGTPPSEKNWHTLEYPLEKWAGKTVGLAVMVSYGGPNGVYNEEAFVDEFSVLRSR